VRRETPNSAVKSVQLGGLPSPEPSLTI